MATETKEQLAKRRKDFRDTLTKVPGSRWLLTGDYTDCVVLVKDDEAFLVKAEYAQVLELERIANALERLVDKEK